jgi:hypothetical protein
MIPAGNFSEGLAPVSIPQKKIGFIDRAGKVAIAKRRSPLSSIRSGLTQLAHSHRKFDRQIEH